MDQEISIPPFFICPISLEIMKDPVTISTGITYDRHSIEKWIFITATCPVTKLPLATNPDVTPNHSVRRLIQAWCTLNSSKGVTRIPTPKPPISTRQIIKLLADANSSPDHLQVKALQTLRSIAMESDTNKRLIEASGAVEFLADVIIRNTNSSSYDDEESLETLLFTQVGVEALAILYNLKISEPGVKKLVQNNELIESLTRVMQRANYESRVHANLLLRPLLEVADPSQLVSLKPDFFTQLVQILNDQISNQVIKSTLHLLIQVCPWGRNKVKAVEAGTVDVLIELILEHSTERRVVELMLTVLDKLCTCAEGRAGLLRHGAGLAVVSKKILRVSQVGNERAIRILHSVSRFSATQGVLQEMLQLGVVSKLCLVVQVECGNKTREKAREILKLHARDWKTSSCIHMNLISAYPS